MDQNEADKMLRRMKDQLDYIRHDVLMFYAELKLKLPSHLKALTLYELEQAGTIITPDLQLPKKATNFVKKNASSTRKRENLFEKMKDNYNRKRNLTLSHFNDSKRQLPQELLNKKLGDLDDIEHIGLEWFRR